MNLADFPSEPKKIGMQTVLLQQDQRLKILISDGEDILNFKADKNYTVQITVILAETP